ncbi:putative 1,4-beta-D-glucan cellobiohydrolase C protein [Rutstroemia sp. NJR-2017a WRK4]|nr:putative 1,4-beta-D-glucan cellobiohydrolase C protein [Rutstroemia sp. NJR-2017a WRK4]
MGFKSVLLTAIALAPATFAQQPAWGQCGGTGWSGATSCVSGYVCTYSNPYYSQCLPGTASSNPGTTAVPTTSKGTTSVPTTTKSTSSGFTTSTKTTSSASSGTTTAAASGNPFVGKQLYVNPYYASEIQSIAIPSLTGAMATKAAAVAKVPTFAWLDTASKVSELMAPFLANIRAANKAGASPPFAGQFVVYDLPDRDCAALASNGEYSIANGGVANYKAYIDSIKSLLVTYSDVSVILVVEPDSLANLVTNLSVQKCANAQAAYLECVQYAITQLNLPNVSMYLDAGHAGWLGWSANIGPAAQLFGKLYKDAGSPAAVRGLATNVANYNAWTSSTCPSYTQGDANCNEKLYVNALAPLLQAQGFPAHFIMDTSRNGVQPTAQQAWGDWCNLIGTGFGVRPTTSTGDALEDAFVWIKPGGEGDGTSDTSSARYDAHCGLADALKPAPEAGTWFQAYFVSSASYASVLLATGVSAQGAAYAQCGGTGWSGSTSCVSGYVCTYSNPYYSQCLPGTATLTTSVSKTTTSSGSSPTSSSSGKTKYIGTNIAGFDFGCGTDGTCNVTAAYPPLASIGGPDGIAQMKHFVSVDHHNLFRLPVGWQYLLNNQLGGTLDANKFATYDQLVQGCLSTGASCIIDIHNYARWNGGIIGQGGPTNAQYASLWSQIAAKYKGNSKVFFGLMNEPHDVPSITTWAASVQAAVTAIRNAGATTNLLLLPGNDWTSAGAFISDGSAAALSTVKNPDGSTTNLIFDVHKYLDSDNSGTHTECVTNNIDTAFAPLATWLRQNNRQAILTETGGGNTQSCITYLCQEFDYLNSNSDVYIGYTGWAAGSFASSYELTETPNGSTDSALVAACLRRSS